MKASNYKVAMNKQSNEEQQTIFVTNADKSRKAENKKEKKLGKKKIYPKFSATIAKISVISQINVRKEKIERNH